MARGGSRLDLRVVTWEKLTEDAIRLAEMMRGGSFDIIVAVARGGLIVARLLSDLLGVRMVTALQVEYYEELSKRGGKPVVISGPGLDVKGRSLLVADDIADTGETLRTAVDYLKGVGCAGITTCTLYVKPWCCYKPDHYVEVVEEWVVFPYEHAETARALAHEGWSYQQLVSRGLRATAVSFAISGGR